MGHLISPKGRRVIGTYEKVPGTAYVQSWKRGNLTGPIPDEWGGETRMEWDSSETQRNEKGEMLVVDDDGNLWSVAECRFIEEEP